MSLTTVREGKHMPTIFYSWQNDRSTKTNRSFIEDALKKAIKRVRRELTVEDAPRPELTLDKDTKDVPGTPSIVDVIFEKISTCGIFVPDLTFVGKSDKGRMIPNANVLIEYGYAFKAVGNERIICVMNMAYGAPEETNLPFNLRHLKHPILYSLSEDANREERDRVAKELVGTLERAIGVIMKRGLLEDISAGPSPSAETSKIQLDLFNKRFDIYRRTLAFFQIVHYFDPSKTSKEERSEYNSLEKDFLRAHRESQFLFDDKSKVFELMEQFRQKANRMVAHRELRETMMSADTPEGRLKAHAEYSDDAKWVNSKFIGLLEEAMKPYLDFQKISREQSQSE
jgi:hypothetical protein